MVASNDTNRPSAAPIRDQRAAPRGVLPRQLQMWVMVGLAVMILAIILVTGHPTPAPRTSTAVRTTEPTLMPPDRIQAYQRQLAEEEARLRREWAQVPGAAPIGPEAATADAAATDPIAEEQRRRDYQSLFADNVALSRRPANAPSYAERPTTPVSASMPPSTLPSPQELALGQPLQSQRATNAPAGVPSPASVAPSEQTISAAHPHGTATSRSPKETGPLRSTDPLQRLIEGTVVETVLINRLEGSFAGPVACLVTTPVFSHDRQRVVIPSGARVLGAAAPVQTWGEARLAVSFHRLVMPDGRTYSLDQFKGLNQIGETGLNDDVNRHYLQVFGASLAIGALSGLAQYGTPGGLGASAFGDAYRQAAGASLAASTGRILDRYLNVLPTITIHEGYRIKVYLTSDLELPAYRPIDPGGAK